MTADAAIAARLPLLERYLQEDPANPALLAETCEAAMAAGLHERAAACIEAGQRLHVDPSAWEFRRARLCIARRELDEAAHLLEELAGHADGQPAIAHDLAYVRLLQGRFEECRQRIAPWLQREDVPAEHRDALQQLWLRATHRLPSLQEGCAWATSEQQAGRLLPGACGVASLLALDAGQFETARLLAAAAGESQPEALVVRACLALAEGRGNEARQGLARAEREQPSDGRIQATIGLCALQSGEIAQAQERFERALAGSMQRHVGTWHALGWARLLRGDGAGAREAFAQALALDRNFAESHGAMALVLGLEGEAAQARQFLRTADRLDAGNVTGRYARAVLAGEARDAAQLQALMQRLLARPGLLHGSLADDALAALGAARKPDAARVR